MTTQLTENKRLTLARGRVYRAKSPKRAMLPEPVYDDRQIISVDLDKNRVLYGCPGNLGNHLKTTVSEFLQWAKREVTDEMPEDGWMPFPLIPRKKRQLPAPTPENVKLTGEQIAKAQEKYLRLHLNPERQAATLAQHYLALAQGAQLLQDCLERRAKLRYQGRRCRSTEEDIETIVENIKLRHLEDFGIPLIWNRTITNIPQP